MGGDLQQDPVAAPTAKLLSLLCRTRYIKTQWEYLTGFRKRRKERQQKAKEEKELQMKRDKKELKNQRRELLKRSQDYKGKKGKELPAIDLEDVTEPTVLDLPDHTVTITDISEIDLAGHNGLRLGQNQAAIEKDEDEDNLGSGNKAVSKDELKKSLKQLKRKQSNLDSSQHPSKKKFSHHKQHKQYDKKTLIKRRKDKKTYLHQKKRMKCNT
ncbi:hypothetical protein FSP39_015395 [Pinctada imbricata]|uniref:Nucleolar protein 12 n=1 Tax=Pinctada imbricata TaxID=66713 RepID=A0AA88Y1A7_PINIB|nr:hypothetical protein FSP39_015395 [Pinctada imbricata]